MPKDRARANDSAHPVTRRAVLTSLPVAAFAAAAMANEDDAHLLELCRAYHEARAEWLRLADLPHNGDYDDPRSVAADQRRREALEALCDIAPSTIEGINAQLRILWIENGPAFRPGTDGYAEEMAEPEYRLMQSLLVGAERVSARA